MIRLDGKVVVVTGASSGIGREAAARFAARGATVIVAARREAALEETAALCRKAGGSALAVVTDVTREDEVKRLAEAALSSFGRLDVWVNNAGVTLFARLEDAPFEEHRRVIETNLFGAMHGARAAVPIFRRQGRGVLINVGSIVSKIGQPFVPSYSISKFALRGLSETLCVELADEPHIRVCSIFPYAIDTQHFESGANYVGRQAHAMPPVQTPEAVANAIVELAVRPRRERHVPRVAVFGLALHKIFPRTTERLLLHALRKWHFAELSEPEKQGNLFEGSNDKAEVRGVRPPRISLLTFLAWAAGELARGLPRRGRHA